MITANFIVPSLFYWNQPFKQQPLTQLYLASIVDEHFQGRQIQTQVTDLRGLDPEELHQHIAGPSDLFLYSIASPDFREVHALVEILRKKFPGAKHIAGGAHVNIFPEETARVFDCVVSGSGEQALIQLLEDFLRGDLKRNYDMDPDYAHTRYPFPRRHYLPREKIVRDNLIKCAPGVLSTSTLFSHGCPFICGFCANYNRRKSVRRSNEEMAAEIEYLQANYGVTGLAMLDEICIPLVEAESRPYLETLKKYKVLWRGQSRVGIQPDILKLAREAGCLELNLGVESVSEKVMEIVKKRIKLDDVKAMIKNCKANDIKVYINLVNGLPGEPTNIVQLTQDFIEETQPDLVNLFSLCLYPGSPIAEHPERYGIDPATVQKEYHRMNHLVRRFKDSRAEDDAEEMVLFSYQAEGPFGPAFSREQILANYEDLQDFVISRGLNK
jgi:radical SAM superfamily enzyme YgiQ (UPF0313 family)